MEARENTESRHLITKQAGKVITWMAGRCYPGKPKARKKIKANGFPLGHDSNQDSAADKMPPLCSASCVFIIRQPLGISFRFHSPGPSSVPTNGKVLSSCHAELCANRPQQSSSHACVCLSHAVSLSGPARDTNMLPCAL